MNKHNICPCVVASMLGITASAWAQTSVDFTPLDNIEQGALAIPHGAVKLIVKAAFHQLPDWALSMLERERDCALEQAAVRTGLQGIGASLAWAFADTGVAARARQRMTPPFEGAESNRGN